MALWFKTEKDVNQKSYVRETFENEWIVEFKINCWKTILYLKRKNKQILLKDYRFSEK